MDELIVSIIGTHESRQINTLREVGSDRILELAPVRGSERASIDLRMPSGATLTIPVEPGAMTQILDAWKAEATTGVAVPSPEVPRATRFERILQD
jgi:hypothetical protein